MENKETIEKFIAYGHDKLEMLELAYEVLSVLDKILIDGQYGMSGEQISDFGDELQENKAVVEILEAVRALTSF